MVLELSLRRYRLGMDLSAEHDGGAGQKRANPVFPAKVRKFAWPDLFSEKQLGNPKGIEGNYD